MCFFSKPTELWSCKEGSLPSTGILCNAHESSSDFHDAVDVLKQIDKQKYARLVPLYLAEMTALQSTNPDIHQEFIDGNFVVNKNQIPFCAIGVDHALEHINRITKSLEDSWALHRMPVLGRDSSLQLSRLAEEAHVMAGLPTTTCKEHHDLSLAVWTRQEENMHSSRLCSCRP